MRSAAFAVCLAALVVVAQSAPQELAGCFTGERDGKQNVRYGGATGTISARYETPFTPGTSTPVSDTKIVSYTCLGAGELNAVQYDGKAYSCQHYLKSGSALTYDAAPYDAPSIDAAYAKCPPGASGSGEFTQTGTPAANTCTAAGEKTAVDTNESPSGSSSCPAA